MASPFFDRGKTKSLDKAYAHFVHSEKDERLSRNHSNYHIDKSLTTYNYSLYNLSVDERMNKLADRLTKCTNYDPDQKPTNHNAKVIMQSFVLYPPDFLTVNDEIKQWFLTVGIPAALTAFGKDNIIDADIHFDEVHDYIDAITHEKRKSKVHAHVYVCPVQKGYTKDYVKDPETGKRKTIKSGKSWKYVKDYVRDENGNKVETYKLNCKKVIGKAGIRRLNNILEDETQKAYGKPYHTGIETGKSRAVDDMKYASAVALEAELSALTVKRTEIQQELERLRIKRDEEYTEEEIRERLAKEVNDSIELQESMIKLYNRLVGVYNKYANLFNELDDDLQQFYKLTPEEARRFINSGGYPTPEQVSLPPLLQGSNFDLIEKTVEEVVNKLRIDSEASTSVTEASM